MKKMIYIILFSASMICFYFAMAQYYKTQELLRSGIKTKGKVSKIRTISDSDGDTYKATFEYTDKTNTLITFENGHSSSPSPYTIGQSVEIIYSIDGSEQKIITFWGLYRWTIILLAIGSPLFIIGGGYIWYYWV